MSPKQLAQESNRRAAAGDWGSEALEINRRLVELLPTAPLPLYRVGQCLLSVGRRDEAIAALSGALELGLDGVAGRIARRLLTEPDGDSAPSTRFVSPPREQLLQLARPLNQGELAVFDYFDRLLPVEWELYVEPHLNGLRPDIVLLHPTVHRRVRGEGLGPRRLRVLGRKEAG